MKTKIVGILVCMLLIATAIPAAGSIKEVSDVRNISTIYDPLDGGWVEERDGVTILHVSGTHYEMGYQHGYLLREKIPIGFRILVDFFNDSGFSYEDLVGKWNVFKEYIPESYMEEMQGVVDGSELSFEEIGVLHIFHDVANLMECCGGIAWGSATVDGKLVHLRSGDMRVFLQDPETGIYLQECQVLCVREPDNGYASLYPLLCGDIGGYGGINERGIGVGENTCITQDTTLQGTTTSMRMRMVLDSADSAEDAIAILNSNRTCGWNLFISDGNIPEGYVLEQTATVSYLCTHDDPVESTAPFWMIEEVMRRANCFVSPECAAMERTHYNPSGLRGLLRLLFGIDPYFGVWTHYKALSKGFEKRWGELDLNSTMDMLRDVYRGNNNVVFNLMMKMYFYQPCHQWVGCPETGEMVISFASPENMAHYEPVHYFNLFELLNSEPPP
ncbi:MAG: hypothetical protein KAW47_04650 [Thermoplasmatales archaeon]|nr:hypothetical protein [Thermoplasmatales archaeon]